MLLKATKQYTNKGANIAKWILACLVPFGGLFVALRLHKQLAVAAEERGVQLKNNGVLLAISCVVFPLLGVNPIALGILQSDLNRIYAKEDAITNGVAV